MATSTATETTAPTLEQPVSTHRAVKLVKRNVLAYKHYWIAFITGFFEPVFYLVAVGFGVGQFIDTVSYGGGRIDYPSFLAPGLLAIATLNGAIFDGFFSPFFKLNWLKTYDGIVTTPISIPDIAVGEILWALIRGTIYGAAFLFVMLVLGLMHSWWALLALPAVMLSSGALSAGAMILTGVTKQISALEKVMTLVVLPLFLFSGTFYPLSVYPDYVRPVIQALPLYHSAALLRALTTGDVGAGTLWYVAYLVAFFAVAGAIAIRLMKKRLTD
ncbi:MAG: ABC transporter permease [Actinomycetota bacterium]